MTKTKTIYELISFDKTFIYIDVKEITEEELNWMRTLSEKDEPDLPLHIRKNIKTARKLLKTHFIEELI